MTPSASAAVRWSCGLWSRRTREVPRRARRSRKCTDIHELTSPAGAGRRRDCGEDRAEVTKERLFSKGKRRRRGRVAGRQKGPELRLRWKTRAALRGPAALAYPFLGAEASKATRNRMRWFSAELCSGPINRHQLFT